MKRYLGTALAGLSLLALAPAAQAHHAFAAEFDANAPVSLKGKVTKVEWINPHTWIHLIAADGKEWMVEGGTPNTLIRNGITRDSLKAGTEIVVRGFQSKDRYCAPACKANGRDITLGDGRKLFVGSSGTGAPKDGSDPTEK